MGDMEGLGAAGDAKGDARLEADKRIKTYLEKPCPLDEDPMGSCGYKTASLGCGMNPDVTEPDKCHHYNCLLNIGYYIPDGDRTGRIIS